MVTPSYSPTLQGGYYPNYYYPQNVQPVSQQVSVQQPAHQILAWVQSEEEGVNFPLNAGQSIFLMNQNEPYLYMKSVDQLGKSTFIKKRLEDEGNEQKPEIDLSEYIKRDEIDKIIAAMIQKEVEKRMSEISFKPTKTKRKIEDDEEE